MTKQLDMDMVLLIHQLIAEETGGAVGVRDLGLLESALTGAFATFGGQDLYKTKEEKGARLGFSLVSNHAFIDGNKRMGMHIMVLFLELNGIHLDYTQDELAEIGLDVASGKAKYEQLLDWVKAHRRDI